MRIRHLEPTHPDHRLRRRLGHPPLLPAPPSTRLLLIRRKVETDKEQEIATQDAHAGEGGKLLAGAAAVIGEVREVGAGEVGVGCEVDEAEVDDELDDLQAGNPFFPPDPDAPRGLEVVPVHHDVHD